MIYRFLFLLARRAIFGRKSLLDVHHLRYLLLKVTLLVCQDEPEAKLESIAAGSTIEVMSEESASGTVCVKVNGHFGYMFYRDLIERSEPLVPPAEQE